MNEDFFKIISRFAEADTRFTASCDLAELMHAERILCFIFDEVENTYIPAPGFPKTLNNAKEWQRFLAEAQNQSFFEGSLVFPGNIKKEALGISSKNGCVLVLINSRHNDITFSRLQTIFVLIAAIMKAEARSVEIERKIKVAEQPSWKGKQFIQQPDSGTPGLQFALKIEEEFLSVASHELKTPITSINAFIQILQSIYPDTSKEKQTHYIVTRIKFQVDQLIRLIGNLFDATRIRSGKLELNVQEISLDHVVDNLIRGYSSSITTHKIIKKGSIIGKVNCDKDRIEQVISNLLDNAIKYSPDSDNIIVTTSTDKNNVLFSVQDFGIGIEDENKNKIFDGVFRVQGEDSGNLSGLGLGLYISADIIKRNNGDMWVDSEPGKGSTFHFSLPISK